MFTRMFTPRAVKVAGAVTGLACGASLLQQSKARFASIAFADAPGSALDPKEWRSFKLMAKEVINHNTAIYRFELPDKEQVVGLPVASCLLTGANIGDVKDDGSKGMIIRPYTPTSEPDAKGSFDLIVKEYPEGKMSKHIANLKVGEPLKFKGPFVKLPYQANMKKEIGMVCGGTGITPMYQILKEVLKNPEDQTQVSLVFANVSEADILLKKELDDLAAQHPNFRVHYVVDKPDMFGMFWKGGVGYITKDMLAEKMPKPSADSLVVVCGPPPMMKAISGDKESAQKQGEVTGILKDMGYTADNVLKM